MYTLVLHDFCKKRSGIPRHMVGVVALGCSFSHYGLIVSSLVFLQASGHLSLNAFVVAALQYNLVIGWRFLSIAGQLVSGRTLWVDV
jgi:hypothetical protein